MALSAFSMYKDILQFWPQRARQVRGSVTGSLDEVDEYPYPTHQMRHPRQVLGMFDAQ